MSDKWDTGAEKGMTGSQVVALGREIQKGKITIEWDGNGFVAWARGKWSPYGLLSELLEDLGEIDP